MHFLEGPIYSRRKRVRLPQRLAHILARLSCQSSTAPGLALAIKKSLPAAAGSCVRNKHVG